MTYCIRPDDESCGHVQSWFEYLFHRKMSLAGTRSICSTTVQCLFSTTLRAGHGESIVRDPVLRSLVRMAGGPGRAVQADSIKPASEATGTRRFKLRCDDLLLNVAFNFELRSYSKGAWMVVMRKSDLSVVHAKVGNDG
jgi:hypothetical protein